MVDRLGDPATIAVGGYLFYVNQRRQVIDARTLKHVGYLARLRDDLEAVQCGNPDCSEIVAHVRPFHSGWFADDSIQQRNDGYNPNLDDGTVMDGNMVLNAVPSPDAARIANELVPHRVARVRDKLRREAVMRETRKLKSPNGEVHSDAQVLVKQKPMSASDLEVMRRSERAGFPARDLDMIEKWEQAMAKRRLLVFRPGWTRGQDFVYRLSPHGQRSIDRGFKSDSRTDLPKVPGEAFRRVPCHSPCSLPAWCECPLCLKFKRMAMNLLDADELLVSALWRPAFTPYIAPPTDR